MKKLMILFICISLGISCVKSETKESMADGLSNVNSAPFGYNGQLNGYIESDEIVALNIADNPEHQIRNASLAKVKLKFLNSDTQGEIKKIEISPEAMDILNRYYRNYLAFCIKPELSRSEVDEKVKRDMNLMLEANKTKTHLTTININAPDEDRKISWVEAGRMIEFVGETATKQCK